MRCYLTTNVIGQCFKNHIIYYWQKIRNSPTLLMYEFKLVHFKKQLGNAYKVGKMFTINMQQCHCWIHTTETSVLAQGDMCTIVWKKREMESHLHSPPKRNGCIRADLQLTLLLPHSFPPPLPPSFLWSQTRATDCWSWCLFWSVGAKELLTIKYFECPLWDKLWFIQAMEFYSTARMNELVLRVFICVKSKNIILNEKQSCRKISFMLKKINK